MSDLQGRAALVTGGGTGLGRAIALALAGAGCDVTVLGRRTPPLQAVVDEVTALGRRGRAVTADVADDDAMRDTMSGLGPVDVVVANAGTIGPLGRTAVVDPVAFGHTLDVNVTGVVRTLRPLLPGMLERGFGRVVTISSGAASPPGMASASAYSASKAAVDMLTVHLAGECAGTGVTVNAVRPGIVDTPMQEQMRAAPRSEVGDAFYDRFHGVHERGELLDAGVPAEFVVRLVGTELTGRVLDVRDAPPW